MQLSLSPLFGNGVVLQAGKPIRVFGRGSGEITVRLQGDAAVVHADGDWQAELPPMPYGGPYTLTVSDGVTDICLSDVMLGDVLLLAGQSNMQFLLQASLTDKPCFPDDPQMRLFVPGWDGVGSGWLPCTQADAPNRSALAYFLGNRLRQASQHAVGLVVAAQGASVIESWMPERAFSSPDFLLDAAQLHSDHFHPDFFWNKPAYLWERVAPQICPFSFDRVIWYQGESDTTVGEARVYDRMLAAMIRAWRDELQDRVLPFTVIVIADLDDPRGHEPGWAALQQAQRRVTQWVDRVTVLESADVCENNNIHPSTKSRLAERIADALLREREAEAGQTEFLLMKSLLEQDDAPVVICDLTHRIRYMNPSAVENYAKSGGDRLVGRSILDCHGENGRQRIRQVVDWFASAETHNKVHTFYNEKQHKDVYMIALRAPSGRLIGYYEKHEFRTRDTSPLYELT